MKMLSMLAAVVFAAGCAGQSQQDADAQAIRDARRQMTFHQKAQVTIAQPAAGSFIPTTRDGMVEVAGTAAHGSAVIVNGQSVWLDAPGAFHARVPALPGINVITVHLHSLWGGEAQRAFLYGDFASPSAAIASGVMLRATAAAYGDKDADVDDFSVIGKALLGQVDMMAWVRQLPPYTWSFPGGSVDVSLADVQFARDQTALSLTPKAVGTHATGYACRYGVVARPPPRWQEVAMRYFEDFNHGDVFELGEVRVTEAEILEFAGRFDPQPFHLDHGAAARSIFGGLIASGWHTGSMYMGLLVRGLLHDVASLGAGGLDELRWLKPVRPGDVLRGRFTVLSKRESPKHPEGGTLVNLGELFNQRGERVFFIRWPALVGKRPAA